LTPRVAWQWPLAVAFVLYVLTAAAIVVARVKYDRRRRLVSRLMAAVGDVPHDAVRPEETASALAVLSGASERRVAAVVFEDRVPRAVNEALAQFLAASLGVYRLVVLASPGGGASRWKRIVALRVLALARPEAALQPLAAATTDADGDVVAAAVTILGGIAGEDAAALLIRVLERGHFSLSRVATVLDRFPTDISTLLRPLLSRPSATSRYWGALLVRRYRGVPWVEEELARLAGDPVPTVRKAAIQSLAALGAPATTAVATVALTDHVSYVRAHAARALGAVRAIGSASRVAALLADRDWWVREAARQALTAMGPAAEPAVLDCLEHPDAFARNGAAEVLQNTGTFERLLTEETMAPGDPARREALRRMREAGGPRLAQAVVDRLPEELRGRASLALRALDRADVTLGV
jgi:HEAT repeat protein